MLDESILIEAPYIQIRARQALLAMDSKISGSIK